MLLRPLPLVAEVLTSGIPSLTPGNKRTGTVPLAVPHEDIGIRCHSIAAGGWSNFVDFGPLLFLPTVDGRNSAS